jgi:type VI secretion system secreted protein VgrG
LWFNGNGHAHHLSGLATQTLADSQSGAAMRYSQLVLDDTPQQSRLELATTQYDTELQLGHHQHQVHNRRESSLGHGASLTTAAYGALRAAQGLLISADGKADGASVLDSAEPLAQLAQAESRVATLAQSAHDHEAKLPGEPAADKLPVALGLKHSQDVLETTQSASQTADPSTDDRGIRATGGGAGTVAAWSEPALTLSAPGGIGWVTPQSIQLFASANLSQTAQDIETGAQGNVQTITQGGTVLFTYGKAEAKRAVDTTGIRLHAATGKTQMRADSGHLAMHAQKAVTVSSQAQIKADSPVKILLAAGGSAITIQGGQILLQAAGSIGLLGNPKSYTGPASASAAGVGLPKGRMKLCEFKAAAAANGGDALVTI